VGSLDDSVTWRIKNRTLAKHEILQNYLAAWFPILSQSSKRILYIDGFAGPGVYEGGEEGSPIIAIKTAKEHILKHKFHKIMFLFIEKDEARAEKLKAVLLEKFPSLPDENMKYEVISREFEETINEILKDLEENQLTLVPTFAFIDPFGYTGFSMDVLEKIMAHPKSEVFITFMSGFIKRFLDDEKAQALNRLFKTDEWKKIRDTPGPREQQVLELYTKQLRACCNIKYLLSFKMINKFNQVIYHLIFCTKHIRGLEVMKEAIWRVDKTGNFTFSDRIPTSQSSITSFVDSKWGPHWVPNAARQVYSKFSGKEVPLGEIKEFVLTETIYPFRKSILKCLEESDQPKIYSVRVPQRKRRRGTFPDDCYVYFTSQS